MNSRKKIAIIDYQLGNLFSVKQACAYLGEDPVITTNKEEILGADYVILPGVGAFGDAMHNLESLDLVKPIKEFIASGKPFMGVCLGLQLLFTESEEFGRSKGLNLIEGVVKKFQSSYTNGNALKVPQIEWNQIYETSNNSWQQSPLKVCERGDYMYFVHSYYVAPQEDQYILSTTKYGEYTYCSSVIKNNIFACQFHPEKSGKIGLEIYKKFLK